MKPAAAIVALAGFAAAAPAPADVDVANAGDIESRAPVATAAWRYCSTTGMCYNSYETIGKSTYRFALPETATGSNYDIAVQLVAPRGTGWIGISWGGSMSGAPLTVAWPNGGTVEVSSRWADDHTMPSMYPAANYTVLGDTNVNSTHWTLSAICRGCSAWSRSTGTKTLSPGSSGIRVAWAQNTQANSVSSPSNPSSNFQYHHYHNYFDADFATAKVSAAVWNAALSNVRAAGAASQAPPPSAVQPPAQPPAQPTQQPGWPWQWPWG